MMDGAISRVARVTRGTYPEAVFPSPTPYPPACGCEGTNAWPTSYPRMSAAPRANLSATRYPRAGP